MTLGYFWAVWTVLSLVTGFFAAWRKLEVPRINALPVMTAYGQVLPPPASEGKRSMGPTVATFAKTWAVWLASAQVIYLLSRVVFGVARNGGDIAAPIVAATGYLWLVPVGLLVGGVLWLLLRAYLGHRPVDLGVTQDLCDQHNPMPSGPVQKAVEPPTQMWTAPTYEGNWNRHAG